MRYIAVLLVAVVSLSGCTIPGLSPKAVEKVQNTAATVCSQRITLQESFILLAATGYLSQKLIVKGDAAIQSFNAFCDSAENLTASNAIIEAGALYYKLTKILEEARKESA